MKAMILAVVLVVFASMGASAHEGMIALYTDLDHSDTDTELKHLEVVDIYIFYMRGYGPEMGPCAEFKFLNSSPEDVLVLDPDWPPGGFGFGDLTEGIDVCLNTCFPGQDAVYIGNVPILNLSDPDTFTISIVEYPPVPGCPGCSGLLITLCEEGYPIYEVIGDRFIFNDKYVGITTPTPPRLLDVIASTPSQLYVTANEPVSAATAGDPSHYTVYRTDSPSTTVGVTGAEVAGDGTMIVLAMAEQLALDVSYTVAADGVEDLEGYAILAGTPGSDIAFIPSEATATLLRGYHATPSEGAVEVGWTLAACEAEASFHVLRSDHPGGGFIELPPAGIERYGLEFSYVDETCIAGCSYVFRIDVDDDKGSRTLFVTEPVGLPSVPLALHQNYPNPFNPTTAISFTLPEGGHVSLGIYDVGGRLVENLVEGYRNPGAHSVEWLGMDDSGNRASSGVYFYRLRYGKECITRKMVLLR